MGAHWSSCPVGDSTSVNPSSHMHIPACRGQRRIMFHRVQYIKGVTVHVSIALNESNEEALDVGMVGSLTCDHLFLDKSISFFTEHVCELYSLYRDIVI